MSRHVQPGLVVFRRGLCSGKSLVAIGDSVNRIGPRCGFADTVAWLQCFRAGRMLRVVRDRNDRHSALSRSLGTRA